MAHRSYGNPPLVSTGIGSTAIAVNASSGDALAAITGLQERIYEARFTVGGDTVAFWKLQHTDVLQTTIRNQRIVITGTNQTIEYIYTYKAERNDVLRVVLGTAVTSSAVADIQAEVMT